MPIARRHYPIIMGEKGELDAVEVDNTIRNSWLTIYSLQEDVTLMQEKVAGAIRRGEIAEDDEAASITRVSEATRTSVVTAPTTITGAKLVSPISGRLPFINAALELDGGLNAPEYNPSSKLLTIRGSFQMLSDSAIVSFGVAEDVLLERVAARTLRMITPGVGSFSLGAGGENILRLYARDDTGAARWLQLKGDGPRAEIRARRSAGGGQFDMVMDVDVGALEFHNENVERWNIRGSVADDFEFAPNLTNRYDLGNATRAVRNLFTNGILIGQDQTATYDAITIDGTDLVGGGPQDSGALIFTGLSFDGVAHDADWKQFVDVTSNAGASTFTLQTRIDAAGFVTQLTITDAGLLTTVGDTVLGGTLQVDGTVTIGDGTAVDQILTWNGNAQDYFAGIDDTDDTFQIGLGTTPGTTPAIVIDSNQRTKTFGRLKTPTRVTGTYTILVTDSVVFGNTDGGAFTATLPAGVSGQTFKVINSGSSVNNLTVAPDGSEDLLGVNSNFILFDGETLDLTFDTTDGWY